MPEPNPTDKLFDSQALNTTVQIYRHTLSSCVAKDETEAAWAGLQGLTVVHGHWPRLVVLLLLTTIVHAVVHGGALALDLVVLLGVLLLSLVPVATRGLLMELSSSRIPASMS